MNNLRLYIFTLACLINFQTAHANDYSYNLKTAPVSDLIGIVNVELDIAVSEHFTLGPSYLGFNYEHSEVDYDSDAFGIRANYYFNKALSGGWLLSLSATYGDFEISKTDNNINYRHSNIHCPGRLPGHVEPLQFNFWHWRQLFFIAIYGNCCRRCRYIRNKYILSQWRSS